MAALKLHVWQWRLVWWVSFRFSYRLLALFMLVSYMVDSKLNLLLFRNWENLLRKQNVSFKSHGVHINCWEQLKWYFSIHWSCSNNRIWKEGIYFCSRSSSICCRIDFNRIRVNRTVRSSSDEHLKILLIGMKKHCWNYQVLIAVALLPFLFGFTAWLGMFSLELFIRPSRRFHRTRGPWRFFSNS